MREAPQWTDLLSVPSSSRPSRPIGPLEVVAAATQTTAAPELDPECQRVARLAAAALDAPIALVTMLGDGRFGLKAAVGLDAASAAAHFENGLCQQVAGYDRPLAVEDTRLDARFVDSAVGVLNVAAYCGVPLTDAGGQVVGTLCTIDTRQRQWLPRHIELLQDLAALIDVGPPLLPRRGDALLYGAGSYYGKNVLPDSVFEFAPIGIAVFDRHGNCLRMNQLCTQWLAQQPGDPESPDPAHFVPFPQSTAFTALLGKLLQGNLDDQSLEINVPLTQTISISGEHESERVLAVSMQRLEIRTGSDSPAAVAFFTEVSDRRRRERELRMAEERLALACEAAKVGLWFWDLRKDSLQWTERCKTIFGLPPDAAVDYKRFISLVHPDDRDMVDRAVQDSFYERSDYRACFRVIRPDGQVRWVDSRGRAFVGPDGELMHLMGAAVDISELKESEIALQAKSDALLDLNDKLADLVEARTTELQQLSQYLIDVAEDEKAQLACELHDELGANLTVVQMEISAALRKVADKQSDVAKHLMRARETVLETTTIKRRIIEGLRPSMIESLGLAEALTVHLEQYAQTTGLKCTIEAANEPEGMTDDLRIALYRIGQESLTNIAKYAEATEVHVRLERVGDSVVLEISDNGKGLPADYRQRATAHGISGMQQRAARFKGVFSIMARTDGPGTRVTTVIPLSTANTVAAAMC